MTCYLFLHGVAAILPVEKPTLFYDTELTGFGLKIQPSGISSWIIEYRPGAGGRGVTPRRLVLGKLNTLTPDEARKLAASLLARVKLGADPAAERAQARKAESVGELIDLFMEQHVRPKRKARTIVLFDGYARNHIRPKLGTRKAPALARSEVERLHQVPEFVTGLVNRYIEIHRPALCRGFEHRALWVSSTTGHQFTTKNLGTLISKITRETLGVDVSPHLFRTAGASTAAIYGRNHPHLASALLNHRDPRVTQEHYNLSTTLSAGGEYALVTQSYRRP